MIAALALVLLGYCPGCRCTLRCLIPGVVVGPSVLGWVRIDAPVQVLSDLGLGMLLSLAGLEIDVERLRGPLARLAGSAFALSVVLALLCAYVFWLAGEPTQPLLLATMLMSTSAGLLMPMLKDAKEESTKFGRRRPGRDQPIIAGLRPDLGRHRPDNERVDLDLEGFLRNGYVAIRGAFDTHVASACRQAS